MPTSPDNAGYLLHLAEPLRCLDPQLIARIDQALCRVGDFGEVRLVVAKNQIRFIQVTQSESIARMDGDIEHDE
jgi:hypothetical protein